jgi:acyl-CoA synthetase (NDP forming)
MSQSGGVGVALAAQLSQLGVGISSFASVGGKLDVSGNDMLMWWEHDGVTRLAVLYPESFGNPRKFARTARRVGASIPVLTVGAGHSVADQALFEQAGVIAARSFSELAETAALLATQPVPAGRTVAIVSNVAGAGMLAADACTALGLTVHRPQGLTKRRLRALLPGGTVTAPVSTPAAISAGDFRRCLELLAADGVDAMIALILRTGASGDLLTAIRDADIRVPLAAVALDQPETVRLMQRPADGSQVPVYDVPGAAAAALAHAARYGSWRARPHGQVLSFPGLRAADARALVTGFLHHEPGGGWLAQHETADLLSCYGIPLAAPLARADTARADTARADTARGDAARGNPAGNEATAAAVTVEVTDDHVFGPLVVLDCGARAARLTPLTDTDADALIHSADAAARLPGQRAVAAADRAALRELLLRVARLADDLPEVTELSLRPVIARPGRVVAADARVKVAACPRHDPFLRKLR